ncbi:exonuclease subunit SbcC [Limnoraphis robusta]|uniref:Nuclease SbcCD subunit C n=1 Tax=Limnoraphis robusta CCNP1315 TaxID=3110306 RepID=A0ABU5TZW9_9CYAN|nr:exonuclease subunit SbcC [Limnoraphis robusta]MEA5520206.1 exonuclease subunit SbcC [Limnoraphis robusta CCNP1315]MEA5546740.1 exonuclease subunit SbcC [Limnoraphis robusta CCNP1324]
MIPYKLTLKNFLSYRDASLDFSGLHTACICGPNGAGKSSLLEAIAWAIWGSSRAATEDDIIHLGETEAQVDFAFIGEGNLYRVIRNRRRGQSGTLDFQVATQAYNEIQNGAKIEFRAIGERGMRATQQKILDQIKLDYDTFINSAYLRQGRADEFMLKRPNERKEILASLLKLNEYDKLADRAKDLSREYKGKIELLQQTIDSIKQQLQQQNEMTQNIANLETSLNQLNSQQNTEREQLQQLQASQHHRQTWEKLRQGEQQQYQTLSQDYQRLQQDFSTTQQQQQEVEAVLKQASEIQAGYARFQTLQATEEGFSARFKTYQEAQQNRQELLEQQRQILQQIQQKIINITVQLEGLSQQESEQLEVLNQRSEVEAALIELQTARNHLNQLDELQVKVTPLLQQRQQLQTQLDRASASCSARLEELLKSIRQLQQNLKTHPELQRTLQQINAQIQELEKKQVYQQRVKEKGLERHNFMERLCARQRDYEAKLAELDQKISLLGMPSNGDQEANSVQPLCPLCDRPLDEHHWGLVVGKHRTQQQEIRDQMWVVNEQLAVAEREIKGFREEYRQLDQELSQYEEYREQRGQIQAKLEGIEESQLRFQQLKLEAREIERSLQTGEFAAELYREQQHLDQQLQQLNYNEQSHVLARNEEKRWRWAEIKQSQLQSAESKLAKIQAQKPELEAKKAAFEQKFTQQQTHSELQQQIVTLDRSIAEIGYNLEEHNQVRSQLRQAQQWLTRVEKLNSAQKQYPQVQQRLEQLQQLKASKAQDIKTVEAQIDLLEQKLKETPDLSEQIQQLERQIQQRRQQMDQTLGQLGSLKQQQAYLESLNTQHREQKQQLETARCQYRVYSELAQAFGKNGIQALMIENVLPQLEAETNQILSRLSANQLHIQFITQRAGRSSKSSKKTAKLIDTLDILIADARGTRPYETYSGGEAFRINFAIRLALAKLLAQRAGTALQMLIIDEGFGTQDAEGCNRLIAAINAISSDFACILTVTHMPHLKEAFQARIEVEKSPTGSQLRLLM